MIDKQLLMKLSEKSGLAPARQELHYLQAATLFVMKDYPLIFKGGTSLWFFKGLPRFSFDLDFSAPDNDKAEKMLMNLPMLLERAFEIKVAPSPFSTLKKSKNGFLYIAKIEGPLFDPSTRGTRKRTYANLTIDMTTDDPPTMEPYLGSVSFKEYFLPLFFVSIMTPAEIAHEKVRAILTRNLARDLFDLWFMLNKWNIKFDPEMLKMKLEYFKKRFSPETFVEKIAARQSFWHKELDDILFVTTPEIETCAKKAWEWVTSTPWQDKWLSDYYTEPEYGSRHG